MPESRAIKTRKPLLGQHHSNVNDRADLGPAQWRRGALVAVSFKCDQLVQVESFLDGIMFVWLFEMFWTRFVDNIVHIMSRSCTRVHLKSHSDVVPLLSRWRIRVLCLMSCGTVQGHGMDKVVHESCSKHFK